MVLKVVVMFVVATVLYFFIRCMDAFLWALIMHLETYVATTTTFLRPQYYRAAQNPSAAKRRAVWLETVISFSLGVSPQPRLGQHVLIALRQNHRPFGAKHAPLARLTPGYMAMLRRFNILNMQFLICSYCHPFWGHIVGMRKPGLLGAEWFSASRTCCPTFCSNVFIICFILSTLSVPGF